MTNVIFIIIQKILIQQRFGVDVIIFSMDSYVIYNFSTSKPRGLEVEKVEKLTGSNHSNHGLFFILRSNIVIIYSLYRNCFQK